MYINLDTHLYNVHVSTLQLNDPQYKVLCISAAHTVYIHCCNSYVYVPEPLSDGRSQHPHFPVTYMNLVLLRCLTHAQWFHKSPAVTARFSRLRL